MKNLIAPGELSLEVKLNYDLKLTVNDAVGDQLFLFSLEIRFHSYIFPSYR